MRYCMLSQDMRDVHMQTPSPPQHTHTHLVYETHMTWSTSVRTTSRNLLVMMELPSANPKREWSVNTVLTPIMPAWRIPSWHRALKAWKERKCSPASLSNCKEISLAQHFMQN